MRCAESKAPSTRDWRRSRRGEPTAFRSALNKLVKKRVIATLLFANRFIR